MTVPDWEDAWRSLAIGDIDPDLLELAEKHLAAELTSADALATRLTAIVTFAGALLTVGVTLLVTAAKLRLHDGARAAFSILVVVVVSLLVAAIARALAANRPRARVLANPALLRYYAEQRTSMQEIRVDTFKLYGAGLEAAGLRNGRAARAVRQSLALVALALTVAAAAALTIYFDTPWPTIPHSKHHQTKAAPAKGPAATTPAAATSP